MYRMHEAVVHYGEAIKAIVNEECGALALQPQLSPHAWITCRLLRTSASNFDLRR